MPTNKEPREAKTEAGAKALKDEQTARAQAEEAERAAVPEGESPPPQSTANHAAAATGTAATTGPAPDTEAARTADDAPSIDPARVDEADEAARAEVLATQGVAADHRTPDASGAVPGDPNEGVTFDVAGEPIPQSGKLAGLDPSVPVQPGSALDPSLPPPTPAPVSLEPEEERPVGL